MEAFHMTTTAACRWQAEILPSPKSSPKPIIAMSQVAESLPFMRKKNDPVSLATALAIRVLPVPGGPYNRIPRGGCTRKYWSHTDKWMFSHFQFRMVSKETWKSVHWQIITVWCVSADKRNNFSWVPWLQWPWTAEDVSGAAQPSPWSGPAACGSHQCHHSLLRSRPPPPPAKHIAHTCYNVLDAFTHGTFVHVLTHQKPACLPPVTFMPVAWRSTSPLSWQVLPRSVWQCLVPQCNRAMGLSRSLWTPQLSYLHVLWRCHLCALVCRPPGSRASRTPQTGCCNASPRLSHFSCSFWQKWVSYAFHINTYGSSYHLLISCFNDNMCRGVMWHSWKCNSRCSSCCASAHQFFVFVFDNSLQVFQLKRFYKAGVTGKLQDSNMARSWKPKMPFFGGFKQYHHQWHYVNDTTTAVASYR